MKTAFAILGTLVLLSASADPVEFRTPAPVPGVARLTADVHAEVRLDAAQTVTVVCPDPAAADWVRTHFRSWFLCRPKEVADNLGVTLVPQINVWGHASASRGGVGKHAALEASPERQSLFEPGAGWNWCLSNPDALKVIRELVVEMHEAFGNPPYFHIGGDEAAGPECASCRAVPYSRLVRDHVVAVAELLKARGARVLLWHDMMLRKGDPRWAGFYANGTDETAKLPDLLPKDIVVCDWYYGGAKPAYPTLERFSGSFPTVTCVWDEPSGIRAQSEYAREHGLYGVMGTVWHHLAGEKFVNLVQLTACGAWGGDENGVGRGAFAQLWRQCGWDMGATGDYVEAGWYDNQISRDIMGL